jgi:hypothetical protein
MLFFCSTSQEEEHMPRLGMDFARTGERQRLHGTVVCDFEKKKKGQR